MGKLVNIKELGLYFGKIKRSGFKNVFVPMLEKLDKLWKLRLGFKDPYFS